jgi:hypothetical protein
MARPEVSGFGFELVLRVPAPAQGEEPPAWALALLEQLAEYVGQTGNLFAPGHTFALGGPLTHEPSCRLTGLLFAKDPELQGRQGPFGRVDFLEVVGISEAERAAAKAWSSAGLQSLLAERDALLVTDPSRPSLLDAPELARRVEEGAAREGSTMGALLVPGLRWTGSGGAAELELEAGSVEDVRRLVQGRLPHGRTLMLSAPDGGPGQMALLAPAARAAVHAGGEGPLRVELSPTLTHALLRTLKPSPGLYRLEGLPGLTVKVR